ncbi:MAG: sulfatase [Bryobacterales bacterium]|nr:sulfatase [Bryobacterales bacterium]
MNRRRFLQAAVAAPAVAASMGSCALNRDPRPNVLFVISDDQSQPHTSAYGSKFVSTPGFDRIASEGVLFKNAFVSTPSCCPSRGSVLAGLDFFLLKEASMNHTVWPSGKIPLYTDMLSDYGYHVGFTGKGWGPGNWQVSGRAVSPAGREYNTAKAAAPGRELSTVDYAGNFELFLESRPPDTPFCFWVGFQEPHRPFDKGVGARNGKNPAAVEVPGFLPDVPEVRGDIADYAYEIEHADKHLQRILGLLEQRGELNNTLIIATSDNGMAFPRAKGNLYDYGTRMPLAIRWSARIPGGRVVDDFVSHRDIAPTILEVTGLRVPGSMSGESLMYVLDTRQSGQVDPKRHYAVFGIERHFPGSRPNGAGYPSRAIRTSEYLYIRNFAPDRNPVGDIPGPVWPADDPVGGYGDTDGGPSKTALYEKRDSFPMLFDAAFGKRPAEELYLIAEDPFQLKNLAMDPQFSDAKRSLSAQLDDYLTRHRDPRFLQDGAFFDEVMRRYPVEGANASAPAAISVPPPVSTVPSAPR